VSEVSWLVSLVVVTANGCGESVRARLYATCAKFSLV